MALTALTVTVFSVLGGLGVITTAPSAADGRAGQSVATAVDAADAEAPQATAVLEAEPVMDGLRKVGPSVGQAATQTGATALPVNSGTGRRAVFSQTEQRVWLVRPDGSVRRTYLVSGSIEDNLQPGTYAVWSRSRSAVGIEDSGTMEWFVRFAHGERAAIGFHNIPTQLGTPLQTREQLGTALSHGCIRQAEEDAIALWKFAPDGTTVVVV